MMDFSPIAVTNRRGLGQVVKAPSITDIDTDDWDNNGLTTSCIPFPSYVEVILARKFDSESVGVWVDKDRIYLLNRKRHHGIVVPYCRSRDTV
ncbi:hypothetical protein BDR04DRAFT_1143438 [Suillus decipiens]|nr:hypothetical protein BDR04DRAFT_1143438 [Suillus decipiens]